MKQYALIVAGGTGSRMRSDLPKQFIKLGSKPILMHTIEAFHAFNNSMNIALVMHPEYIALWEDLCSEHNFILKHKLVKGGNTRFHSVRNGLRQLPNENNIVGIHDAARPFIDSEFLNRCFKEANHKGNAIPFLDSTESLRYVENNSNKIIDRNLVKKIQTPQCFKLNDIKLAYNQKYDTSFTDDASVYEAKFNSKIFLVDGADKNIKITTPVDLALAELILSI